MKLKCAFISQFCTWYIAWSSLKSYILTSYEESPHETETVNQFFFQPNE